MRVSRFCWAVIAGAVFTASSARAEDVVRFGNLKFVHYGAVFYMKELAPKYGLKIEETIFAKGIDIYPAVAADKIDVAASAADGAIAARGNGVPLIVVAGFSSGGARIVTKAGSPIRTVADLRGKRVATAKGGAHELLLLASLEKAGLTWWNSSDPNDVELVMMGYGELNQALATGQVDAICQSEPQAALLIAGGIGEELHKPYDTAVGVPIRTLVMSEKLYTQRRDVAERVVRLLVEATEMFRANPALAQKYIRETVFEGKLTVGEYQGAMDNAEFSTDLTAGHVQSTTDMMTRYGLGRMARSPVANDWVKLDLLAKAKRDVRVQ
jgi:NitT/TauT family transport system substrate-binding protein